MGTSANPSAITVGYTNAAGGTTNGLIVKLNGTSNTIVNVGTSDTEALGIVLTGGGTSGTAQVATVGAVACTFDNSTTAGHYVQISTGTAANCTDAGAPVPVSGGTILGRVIDGGAAGSHQVALAITPIAPGGPVTLTDGATVTWAIASNPASPATLTFTTHGGNRTLNITGPVSGKVYLLKLIQDGTGGEGLTLGTGCTWKVINGGSGAVTLSTGANAVDFLTFYYDGTNCNANLGKNYN
jgi:hypothetical protein